MRDRLIEILSKPIYPKEGVNLAEVIADYLIDNGVIVPPCKVGETVYSIVEGIDFVLVGEIYEYVVGREHFVFRSTRKGYFTLSFTELDIGKTVFLTRAEAEKALAERSGE
jgi:hypothetical protein